VVDLGAATGYVLAPLYQAGVDVLGVDISDSSKAYAEMAAPGLGERIIYGDLNEPLSLKKRHDVAVCIEVLEHLRPESADIAVRSVCAAADVCLVTASPGGGTHPNPLHLNEMPFQSYWVPKFEAEGKVISPEITTAIKVMMRTLYDLKWYIVPSWFFSGYFAAFVDAD
jgi:SAM-dependent methyltransferase